MKKTKADSVLGTFQHYLLPQNRKEIRTEQDNKN